MILFNIHAYISTFLLFSLWQTNQLKKGKVQREYNALYPDSGHLAILITVIVCWCPILNLFALYDCIKETVQDITQAIHSIIEQNQINQTK